MSQANLDFGTEAEQFFLQRLHNFGAFVYPVGPNYPLKERIREAIRQHKLDCVVIGRHDKRAETFAQCFERYYGEPLEPKPSKRKGKEPCSV